MSDLNALDQTFLQNNPEMARFLSSKENAIASKLIAERIKLSKTVEEIATELNIAPETIIQIENGIFKDIEVLKKLIDFFGVKSIDIDFFTNKELQVT